ncbi:MAG: alpha-amylase family glycosyl hydrolase [Acidimicrobiales bacterium]
MSSPSGERPPPSSDDRERDPPGGATVPWWRRAVVYQIYPRSFADSDGDGIGDLNGIRAHLPDLAWLGVDAVWLSPFFPSPMADFGYDVADYCDVDPVFGSLADFDALLEEAHRLGLRVIIDWVPNHSSDQHPWFLDARSSRASPHRNWYVWRDSAPGDRPPNNWVSTFDMTRPAWTKDEATGQWYLHIFEPEQPDLNWDEPAVEAAMHDVLRFWLDRGVDGIRADVIHCIGKDPDLPDDGPERVGVPRSATNDEPVTHERLRGLRKLMDGYPGERMMVGEVYLFSPTAVASYYGDGDELQLAFNFKPLFTPWWHRPWITSITETVTAMDARRAWPTWVLSNHDNPRPRTRYDRGAAARGETADVRARRSERRLRAATVLLLTLRGTPFLYQGDELGLEDAVIPADRTVDPGGRDGSRAPLPWTGSDDHGWPSAPGVRPWLPFPPEAHRRNYAMMRDDPGSILHLHRRALALRRTEPVLGDGDFALLPAPEGVVAFRRSIGSDQWLVLVNFTDVAVEVRESPALAGTASMRVAITSDGHGEGAPFGGSVRADQALVLRP